mmetsp:Transcript_19730/g.32425  ORF Transcript_19730/g.32425 Transcript_19730/m.32425 type:complete len:310 (+) Transcript_19730:401-1330(+)
MLTIPSVAVKASAKLELSTFAVRNIEFRADFALGSQDLVDQNVYRNFCCLKDAHSESFNRMSSFSLITPYPSVSMECEWKDKQVHYMKAFEVSFWLFEPFERKFIQILLPIIIILILGIINVFAIQSAPEFISNTSSVALTLVFLLPSMSPQGGAKETKFSTNDRAVALIFIALVVNCCKFFFFTSVSGVEEQNNISESVASGISLVLIRDIILPATCAALFASSLIYPIKNYNEFTALKKSIAKTNYFGKPFNVSTNQDVVVSSKTKIDFLRVQTHQPPKKKDPKNMKGQDLSSRRCYKASLHFGFRE